MENSDEEADCLFFQRIFRLIPFPLHFGFFTVIWTKFVTLHTSSPRLSLNLVQIFLVYSRWQAWRCIFYNNILYEIESINTKRHRSCNTEAKKARDSAKAEWIFVAVRTRSKWDSGTRKWSSAKTGSECEARDRVRRLWPLARSKTFLICSEIKLTSLRIKLTSLPSNEYLIQLLLFLLLLVSRLFSWSSRVQSHVRPRFIHSSCRCKTKTTPISKSSKLFGFVIGVFSTLIPGLEIPACFSSGFVCRAVRFIQFLVNSFITHFYNCLWSLTFTKLQIRYTLSAKIKESPIFSIKNVYFELA